MSKQNPMRLFELLLLFTIILVNGVFKVLAVTVDAISTILSIITEQVNYPAIKKLKEWEEELTNPKPEQALLEHRLKSYSLGGDNV